ncbi:MAG: hypothetical protein II970_00690 [Paludibacteraceae bacterium]|nr:hypothetical protein [Paludibacteraceae bacterium]
MRNEEYQLSRMKIFEQTRAKLIADVRSLMTDGDKQSLLSARNEGI